MYPILVQLGPLTIYSLWICAAIGFFVAFLLIYRLLQKDRNAIIFLADHCLVIFFGGIVAARLIFVISNYKGYFAKIDLQSILQIFFIWDKGLSFWGGLLGVNITLAYFCRKQQESIWRST